jgi:hypothetical protein
MLISMPSVTEETGVHIANHQPDSTKLQCLSHKVVLNIPCTGRNLPDKLK